MTAVRLRVIEFGNVSALSSLAAFHGLAEALRPGDDPILSFASPETPFVCVGVHQEVAKEVDEDFCRANGLPVYRRQIGGGAVYLDHNQLFTHFIYPSDKVPAYAANLYPMFIEPVVRTYRELGVQAEYRPINDIHVAGRKIGGTGAANIGEATVMAGSFMFDFDTATMAKCLKVPSEKFRDKLKATLDDYMTTMKKELDSPPTRDEIKRLFLKHCAECLDVIPEADEPTVAEREAITAQETALTDPDWTYRVGHKFVDLGVKISADTHLTESAHKAPGGLIRVQLLARETTIADLALSGDFTCLPPTGIDALANALVGTKLEEQALTEAAEASMKRLNLDMPGVPSADVASAILAAVHNP